jgi:hypothetical protein
MEAYL